MLSLFSLILFQIIVPIHPRRLGNRHKNLQSSMVDQEAMTRFSTLNEGKNWAEVTHLPPGWEILDFGAPGDQMRFQNSRGHSKGLSDDISDLVRCVQGSDGKIHCGPSPPSTNPNHGAGLAKIKEDVSDWKPEHASLPGGIFTKDVGSGEGSPADGNPTSSETKSENTKPNDKEQNSPSSENSLGTSDQSSSTGDTEEKKSKDSTGTKPGTESENKGKDYVIGGGFVVTLKSSFTRVQNAERIIAANERLKLQKMEAVTMADVDIARDLAPSSFIKEAEIACAKSHIKAIQKVADPVNQPRDALWFIFEDDVQLKPNFLEQVIQNVRALNRPWDILNTWLMPPRHAASGGGQIDKHWVIADGYWGMQGYVLTPNSAERLLKCLDPPDHKVWAQVDEMIGCCAASSKSQPSTRCVYHTKIPKDIPLDIHVYCMTPALLTHMDKTLGSYAHKRRSFFWNWKSENNPLLSGTKEKETAQIKINQLEKNNPLVSVKKDVQNSIDQVGQNVPLKNNVKLAEESVGNLEKEMRDMEKSMEEQNARYMTAV